MTDRPYIDQRRVAPVSWFHEFGFVGPEDFEEALAAVEALGFTFVYGGATADPDWRGWPARADAIEDAVEKAWERNDQDAKAAWERGDHTGATISRWAANVLGTIYLKFRADEACASTSPEGVHPAGDQESALPSTSGPA